jgi:mRNA interferase HigB
MHVITKKRIRSWYVRFPDAKEPLEAWLRLISSRNFHHLPDLRTVIPSADQVGPNKDLYCFNIKGNTYRLIVGITFPQTVFVKEFLPKSEYSRKYRAIS